ncbi:hypothetical protein T265_08547 [Opisthorchis viverrini]|uniref:Uncharacterized protein n=1 Tax=Opisthorchis viverrini TaxID=6198 RepID=A0A074ZD76_OPIVI|nr:hypothetical protein T265_08547 [Opisthorchis viverrini]KER23607.1 hypothetical protein T265_08547 [Opisthorchis viverrini]
MEEKVWWGSSARALITKWDEKKGIILHSRHRCPANHVEPGEFLTKQPNHYITLFRRLLLIAQILEKLIHTRLLKWTETFEPLFQRVMFFLGAIQQRYHGLPKTHKPDVPVKLTVDGIGSSPHELPRFLSGILKPLNGRQLRGVLVPVVKPNRE